MEENKKNEILKKTYEIEKSVLMENLKKRDIDIENLKNENNRLIDINKNLQSELDKIIYSRSYKIVKKLTKLVKRG